MRKVLVFLEFRKRECQWAVSRSLCLTGGGAYCPPPSPALNEAELGGSLSPPQVDGDNFSEPQFLRLETRGDVCSCPSLDGCKGEMR